MSIEVRFACCGCDATATGRIRRTATPIYPGSSLCVVSTDSVEGAAPEGWVAFDPYTYVTYCPECWATIEVGDPDQAEGECP